MNKVGQTYDNIIDLHVYYRFTVPFASVGLSVDPSPNESLEDQALHSWHLELLPENRVNNDMLFTRGYRKNALGFSWSSFSIWERYAGHLNLSRI